MFKKVEKMGNFFPAWQVTFFLGAKSNNLVTAKNDGFEWHKSYFESARSRVLLRPVLTNNRQPTNQKATYESEVVGPR